MKGTTHVKSRCLRKGNALEVEAPMVDMVDCRLDKRMSSAKSLNQAQIEFIPTHGRGCLHRIMATWLCSTSL